jgi:hypothetical protein
VQQKSCTQGKAVQLSATAQSLVCPVLHTFVRVLYVLLNVQLYEVEGADPTTSPVQRVQWLSYGAGPGQMLLQGHRLLIVDEVGKGGAFLNRCCVGACCTPTAPLPTGHQQSATAHLLFIVL